MIEKISGQLVAAYLFYDHTLWHKLLSDMIGPFIKEGYAARQISAHSIYLSYDRGAHIKLIFSCVDEDAAVKERLSELLHDFFATYPSHRIEEEKYPVKSFFMDYHNNTFFYENYEFRSALTQQITKVNQCISDCLIIALGNDEIDDGILFTFIIYLQLGFIRAAERDINKAHDRVKNLMSYLEQQPEDETYEVTKVQRADLSLLFEQNKSIFLEILEDVWTEDPYRDDLKWMDTWDSAGKVFLESSDFEQAFVEINDHIYSQLGLSVDNQILSNSTKLMLDAFNDLVDQDSIV